MDINEEINELTHKILLGDSRVEEKIRLRQERITVLLAKKEERLKKLELMTELFATEPEVLGCAWILPLTQLEFQNHYGMSRDDEVEAIAIQTVIDFERKDGWTPEDVSNENAGYDVRSTNAEGIKRYIEVKGRSAEGGVMLSENEYNRLEQLGDNAWLYIVFNCKGNPDLFRLNNPVFNYAFDRKSRGIQYFLAQETWKSR